MKRNIQFVLASFIALAGGQGLAMLGGCSTGPQDEHVGAADQHLDAEQCTYFDVNGKDTICHYTGSATHPYTIVKTSDQGCINGHAGHEHDYIAVDDPTCQGGGCLPESAPCDATLPCCSGSTCSNGTCVPACVYAVDPATCPTGPTITPPLAGACGSTAPAGAGPFFLSLQITFPDGTVHHCGGALVSGTKAVTSAHCLFGSTGGQLVSVAGDSRTITTFTTHPGYDPATGLNDIATLRFAFLPHPPAVRAVTMAASNAGDYSDQTVTIYGDGGPLSGAACAPDYVQPLQAQSLAVLTNTACSSLVSTSISDGDICLYDSTAHGLDWCASDDGGPIVAGTTLVGIQRQRLGCNADGTDPLVGVRVSFYRSWIDAN
jgi:hypothetical protein